MSRHSWLWSILAAGLKLALFAGPASAQQAEDPADICLKASAQVIVGGDTTKTVPGVRVDFDGPVATGPGRAFLRAYVRADLTALPGQTVDITQINTVTSVEIAAGVYHRFGNLNVGDQRISTSWAAEYGFATFPGSQTPDPLVHYPRAFGAGLRFTESNSHAYLSVLYGRAQSVGDFGGGQLLLSAEVPLTAAQKAIFFGGDARLSLWHTADQKQADAVRLYVGVQIPELVAALGKH